MADEQNGAGDETPAGEQVADQADGASTEPKADEPKADDDHEG